MSEQAKVGVEVIRPASPLAPAPQQAAEVSQSAIDGLLLKLPEWQEEAPTAEEPAVTPVGALPEEEATTESPAPAMGANPIAIRVGVAKPRAGAGPFRRSRVTRTDMPPSPPPASQAQPAATRAPATRQTCEFVGKRAVGTTSAPPNPSPPNPAPPNSSLAKSPQERVRSLSSAEQQKIARGGELADRVALERLYGKAVWETLLHNQRLTPPEVLRIARMAGLPTPMLELIVGNRSWLNSPQVRRALLANRRLGKEMIMTVLRATPKNELRIMHKQTAYPPMVREAAAKLLS